MTKNTRNILIFAAQLYFSAYYSQPDNYCCSDLDPIECCPNQYQLKPKRPTI